MFEKILKLHAYIFGRKIFYKFNLFLYHLALRGLGILNYQNDYLTGETIWLKKYIKNKKAPVILDIGANVGEYSSAAFKINKNSKILAFEPHPKTYKVLTNNIKNDNFKAYNFAVGDEENILNLYDYDDNDGSKHASLYKKNIIILRKGNPISHKVKIIKLDDFLKDKNIDIIDLIKIDAEGNELKVLFGIKKYLQNNKIKAIHFEFNDINIISESTFKDFWDLLENYNLYRILPGGELLHIKEYLPILCEIYSFQNIIAILKKNK